VAVKSGGGLVSGGLRMLRAFRAGWSKSNTNRPHGDTDTIIIWTIIWATTAMQTVLLFKRVIKPTTTMQAVILCANVQLNYLIH
jgi:hypothetical protein